MAAFSSRVIQWQHKHGRHNLPWQDADAYRVWLSEIMLQQTQVITVIPYFQKFVASFPDIPSLASATEERVLAHWSGLGYYSRARNLHRSAQQIMQQHAGEFPAAFDDMLALPGIGRSTAAAISALVFRQRRAILDGNVKRVLARHLAVPGWTGEKKIEAQLWAQAEARLPARHIAAYTQGMMDLGAMICTRSKPRCSECPVQDDCEAYRQGRVAKLPVPRPRKVIPERHSTFLLLLNGTEILLEKRPGSGIWGGLWCPPQIDDGKGVLADYVQRNGIEVSERIDLEEFTHTFTHFKLHITPVVLHVPHKPSRVQQTGSEWMGMEAALQSAIPTPVRKILTQLPLLAKAG